MAMRRVARDVYGELYSNAEILAKVHLQLVKGGGGAKSYDADTRTVGGNVKAALKAAYPTLNQELLVDEYLEGFFAVRQDLRKATVAAAGEMLRAQIDELLILRRHLRRGDTPAAITEIARQVRRKLGGEFRPSVKDHLATEKLYGPQVRRSPSMPDNPPESNPDYRYGLPLVFKQSVRSALGWALQEYSRVPEGMPFSKPPPGEGNRSEVVQLCKIISVHPDFVQIYATYADSAALGAALADQKVLEAINATGAMLVNDVLVTPEHVWRYSPFVLRAVQDLGLDDIDGFSDYARALSVEISEPWYHTPLVVASIALAVVAVLASGPLAESTAPGVTTFLFAAGVFDVGVLAFSASMDFIRKREDEIAAVSSGFNEEKFAEQPEWTLWAGITIASALMAAISVVGQGLRMARLSEAAKALPPSRGLKLDKAGKTIVAEPPPSGKPSGAQRAADRRDAVGTDARRREAKPAAGAPPRRAPRGGGPDDDPEARRLAATGSTGVPVDAVGPAPAIEPRPVRGVPGGDVGAPPQAVYGSRGTGGPPVIAAPLPVPPGRSSIRDSSIGFTAAERLEEGAAKEAERRVTAKLAKERKLTPQDRDSEAAKILSTPADANGRVPQPTEPALLVEPVVTSPKSPPPEYTQAGRMKKYPPLGSAKPDNVILMPGKVEVVETTLDVAFIVVDELPGTVVRGPRYGPKHKVIQLAKAQYLLERFKDLDIVYNIQTWGPITSELVEKMEAALLNIRRVQKAIGATGDFEFILRTDTEIRVFR